MDVPTYTHEEYSQLQQYQPPRPILKNTLQVFMKPRNYYSGDTISGYVELKCCLGLRIFNVEMDYCCVEQLPSKRNYIHQTKRILNGRGSTPPGKDIISGVIKLFSKKAETSLPVGTFKYPFTLHLPQKLPPTFKSKNGSIVHQLLFTVNTPKDLTPLRACIHLQVMGTLFDLNLIGNNSVPFNTTSNKNFMLSKGTLDSVVTLPGRIYPSGSKMVGEISHTNSSNRELNHCKISLVQDIDAGSSSKRIRNVLSKAKTCGCKQGKSVKSTFQLLVPFGAVESIWKMENTPKDCKAIKYINVTYKIIVDGDIGMATNLKMEVPMLIIRPELTQVLSGRGKVMTQQKYNLNLTQNEVQYKVPEMPKTVQTGPVYVNDMPNIENVNVNVPEYVETQIPHVNIVESNNEMKEEESMVEKKDEEKKKKKVIPPPPPAHLIRKRNKQVKEQMKDDDLRLLEEFNKPIEISSQFSKDAPIKDESINEEKKDEIGLDYVQSLPEQNNVVEDDEQEEEMYPDVPILQ